MVNLWDLFVVVTNSTDVPPGCSRRTSYLVIAEPLLDGWPQLALRKFVKASRRGLGTTPGTPVTLIVVVACVGVVSAELEAVVGAGAASVAGLEFELRPVFEPARAPPTITAISARTPHMSHLLGFLFAGGSGDLGGGGGVVGPPGVVGPV